MTRRWLLSVALALSAAVLFVAWFLMQSPDRVPSVPEQPTAANEWTPLLMQWHAGVSQQYRVLSESSMGMQAATNGSSSIHVHLQGVLDTLILQTENNQALVGMRLSTIRLKINGSTDDETDRALGVPFRVLFADNGMPLRFEFPAEINRHNRSILENLVRTFQLSLKPGDSWITNERNSSGTYAAAYQRTGAYQIHKSKHNFHTTAAGMVNWSTLNSTESIIIEPGYNWIRSMKIEEQMNSEGQGGPAMNIKQSAALDLMPSTQVKHAASLWAFDATTTPSEHRSKINHTVPDLTAEQARRQILATIPVLDATKQGRLSHIHRLRDLLRVHASLPGIILQVLETHELSDRTRADLYLALELAGTESAQAALVQVITDSSWSLKDGMRAIVAMAGVEQPSTESISALWRTTQNYAGGERQRMANSATFALGSMGNSLRQAENPLYSSLRSDLLSHALGSGDLVTRSNYVTALGNTQDRSLARDVVVLLDDVEPQIRRVAALSLGTLGVDQVADQLVSYYSEEDNGYVRGAIAESLQSWTQPSDTAMALFRQTVRTEPDESTRYHIALLLSQNLGQFPENEPVLKDIMRSETSKRIRQQVAEALATQ